MARVFPLRSVTVTPTKIGTPTEPLLFIPTETTIVIGMVVNSGYLWTMTYPDIARQPALPHALYRMSFAIGGPGFSVPFGIFIAGVAVTAGLTRLIPRWLTWFGIAIAVCGELSWFEMVSGKFLPLIPLTRFPGFLWSILVGFKLPRTAAIASCARLLRLLGR